MNDNTVLDKIDEYDAFIKQESAQEKMLAARGSQVRKSWLDDYKAKKITSFELYKRFHYCRQDFINKIFTPVEREEFNSMIRNERPYDIKNSREKEVDSLLDLVKNNKRIKDTIEEETKKVIIKKKPTEELI